MRWLCTSKLILCCLIICGLCIRSLNMNFIQLTAETFRKVKPQVNCCLCDFYHSQGNSNFEKLFRLMDFKLCSATTQDSVIPCQGWTVAGSVSGFVLFSQLLLLRASLDSPCAFPKDFDKLKCLSSLPPGAFLLWEPHWTSRIQCLNIEFLASPAQRSQHTGL